MEYRSPPPITGGYNPRMMVSTGDGRDMVSSQQIHQPNAGKVTNVIMPNQAQAVIEYTTEPWIPEEFKELYPLQTMLLMRRSLGCEGEFDSAVMDQSFDFIQLLLDMGEYDLAAEITLSHLYSREGLRTRDGFEREHQIMQKNFETLTTIQQQQKKKGFWGRVFGGKDESPPVNTMDGGR